MPIYEFRCGACNNDFDKLIRSFSDATLVTTPECPHCGASDTRRLVSSVAFLKGASAGVGRAAYPTSWTQAKAGDPETIKYWKRRVEREMHEESVDPGLRQEREVTANRQWSDYLTRGLSSRDSAQANEALQAAANVVDHGHDHDHGHSHPHPHPHPHPHVSPSEGATASADTPPQHSANLGSSDVSTSD